MTKLLPTHLGTSKLAKLNNRAFSPVLRTRITRDEYDMCDGANSFEIPDQDEARALGGLKGYERQQTANSILQHMVDNGTVFSDRRIHVLAAAQQSVLGRTDLTYAVQQQLSPAGKKSLTRALNYQGNRAKLARWQLT